MASVTSEAKAGASYGPARQGIQSALGHLALAAVGEQLWSLSERKPSHLVYLVRRLRRELADPPARVAEQEEADDLENALSRPAVGVAHVAELLDEAPVCARLLQNLAHRGVARVFAWTDIPLRKRPEARLFPRRPDRSEDPVTFQLPHQHAAGRELPLHRRR